MILHVTNGEGAAAGLRAGGIAGDIVTWDDVLHDGPVPAAATPEELGAIRAAFLAERGWTTVAEASERLARRDARLEAAARADEEIVLWFEHDLYDQLQLLQVLDRLADADRPARVTLIQHDDYLGTTPPEALASLFPTRRVVTEADLACATEAWAAFGHDDPRWLARMAARPDLPLPWVAPALRRLLAQYPGVRDGLSTSERLALRAVAAGAGTPARAFLHVQQHDQPYFLGDLGFAGYLEGLAEGPAPLLARADGSALRAPSAPDPAFWHGELIMTDHGRMVLAGDADWILLHSIDRWYGGVHLEGHVVRWRWDDARGLVEAT